MARRMNLATVRHREKHQQPGGRQAGLLVRKSNGGETEGGGKHETNAADMAASGRGRQRRGGAEKYAHLRGAQAQARRGAR